MCASFKMNRLDIQTGLGLVTFGFYCTACGTSLTRRTFRTSCSIEGIYPALLVLNAASNVGITLLQDALAHVHSILSFSVI